MTCEIGTSLLVFLALSVLATDRLQTENWIGGTPENPLATPAGGFVYETNPILAGKPEMLDPYFDFWEAIVELAPRMLSPPLSMAVLGAIVVDEGRTVIQNNRLADQVGLPQYWAIKLKLRF